MRIAVGGFHIEACTFSPLMSTASDFHVERGDELLANYPFLTGVEDVTLVPLVRARAIPGGCVDHAFYAAIKAEFIAGLRQLGPWDGVFLHLHGAVSVAGLDDAEADWIAAVHAVVGPDCVLAASYDLHGNVSPHVIEHLDVLTAYRTAPHVDWYATLERAGELLLTCIRENIRPHTAFIRVPVLLPGECTSTEWDPAQRIYAAIPAVIAREQLMDASILVGYVWADEPRASATVIALGTDPAAAARGACTLAQLYWDARHEFAFGVPALPVDECIAAALQAAQFPVVISDSGDNPTAGGVGDIPYVLERLLAHAVPAAVVAGIADAAAVAACFAAGIGAELTLSLGGKLDPVHGRPLSVTGTVQALVNAPWPYFGATPGQLINRQALLRVGGVLIIVTEQRTPFHHLEDFRRLGIEPAEHKLIVVKIGYLVPELKALAGTALLALSPGAVNQDVTRLPYQRIQRPLYPFDPDLEWHAEA